MARVVVADSIPELIRESLADLPSLASIELVGSRARGEATEWSDWDFRCFATDFEACRVDLPERLSRLRPLVAQWDRLGEPWCYMLILSGPTKVDLIFEAEAHRDEPPWVVTPETLHGIDDHFWDWTLWLVSKAAAGNQDLLASELLKMQEHLLAPLGVPQSPSSLDEAVDGYLAARNRYLADQGLDFTSPAEVEVGRVIERFHRAHG